VFSRVLGTSGKSVTLETLSLTKFSKHVFQEQGIRDSRNLGISTVDSANFGELPIRESDEDPVRDTGAQTCTNQLGSEGQLRNLLKTWFGSFLRRYSRTGGRSKVKVVVPKSPGLECELVSDL
jgi:hypothetical protein